MSKPLGLTPESSWVKTILIVCLTLSAILTSCTSKQTEPAAQSSSTATSANQATASKLPMDGLVYSPYHLGQGPDYSVYPSADEIAGDIPTLASLTSSIRVYSSLGPARDIVQAAERARLSVNLGIWLGRNGATNKREIAAGIALMASPAVTTITVGNEVLLRGDLSEEQLRGAIQEVRAAARKLAHPVPVTTAEVAGEWLEHKALANDVDLVTVHLYPFWQKVAISDAIKVLDSSYANVVRTFPGKEVMIGETGWPSEGPPQGAAVPSGNNQARYFRDFLAWTKRQSKPVPYYYFDVFDEAWKSHEAGVGAHWGLYDQDGKVKTALQDLLPDAAPQTLAQRAYRDIYVGGLSAGLGLGVDTSEHKRGWLTAHQGTLTLAYPPNQKWGSMFITVGQPVPPGSRPAINLSQYRSMVLEMRLAPHQSSGSEATKPRPGCVRLGIKDRTQPDSGSETTRKKCLGSSDWVTIRVPLSAFKNADPAQLYVVFEVAFSDVVAPIQLRNIRYSLI